MDLSWPPGRSVNNGINKDCYLGRKVKLKFPKVDDLARCIYQLGPGCLQFKTDLHRAFRQMYIDMLDIPLVGFKWRGKYYYDKVLSMGSKSHPQSSWSSWATW